MSTDQSEYEGQYINQQQTKQHQNSFFLNKTIDCFNEKFQLKIQITNLQTPPPAPQQKQQQQDFQTQNYNNYSNNILQQQQTLQTANPQPQPLPQQQPVNQQLNLELIRGHLILLLHAQTCAQPPQVICFVPPCSTIKELFSHMIQCNEGKKCSRSNCASSRLIINHWKNCNKSDCPVCSPLQQVKQRQILFHQQQSNTNS